MNQKTMLDMGGLAFLEGDPLGLRELEEQLVWNSNGPLPDWLDDDDIDDDLDGDSVEHQVTVAPIGPSVDNPDLIASKLAFTSGELPTPEDPNPPPILPPPPVMQPAAVVVNSPHEPGPPAPSLIDQAPLPAVRIEEGEFEPFPDPDSDARFADNCPADEGLRSIDELLRFVDEPPSAIASPIPPPSPVEPALPTRRVLGFDELIDLRLCLLAEIAGQAWAVPLDRVMTVGRRRAADTIDLYERFEGRPRKGEWAAVTFDNDRTLLVDRILGPRSLAWEPLPTASNAPDWALAETSLAGESIRLLDWEMIAK